MIYTLDIQLEQIQKVLQYTFVNINYLRAALWDQETGPHSIPGCLRHGRDTLAAIGESTVRTAFLLDSQSSNSGKGKEIIVRKSLHKVLDRLAQQLRIPELSAIGYCHGFDRLVDLSRCRDGGDIMLATIVKALLGAVFVDSSQNMSAIKHVMEALGLFLNPVKDPISHQQKLLLRMHQIEASQRTSRTASPDCFNGPDCGCGCLWLDQYSSAGWYTPTRDGARNSSATTSHLPRSHSNKKRQLPLKVASEPSSDRLKNWIVEVENDVKRDSWTSADSSLYGEHVATDFATALDLSVQDDLPRSHPGFGRNNSDT